jgi:hypothetical protein
LTDLSTIVRIYQGSNGDATRMLYRDLEAFGPMGVIAVNLFRACKCSERAKVYRKGPGYRTEAYARKDWSIRNLASALHASDAHGLAWGWAIDRDLQARLDPHHHILYVDLPTGQVSFHNGQRYEGPDYRGQWDEERGAAANRICRFVAELFRMEATA